MAVLALRTNAKTALLIVKALLVVKLLLVVNALLVVTFMQAETTDFCTFGNYAI